MKTAISTGLALASVLFCANHAIASPIEGDTSAETIATSEVSSQNTSEKSALFEINRPIDVSYVESNKVSSETAPQRQGQRADISEIIDINVAARIDYQRNWLGSHTEKGNTGFQAKYLNLRIDGQIIPGLTYSWRQRFSKCNNFFDATDWVYLNYDLQRWSFSAGKQVILVGGWEYDANPINEYAYSVYCQNVTCYGLGVNVGYALTPKDKLKFQVSQSPFAYKGNRDMYAYNLFYEGNHGIFQALYSLNMMEYADGKYISYIALGNKFNAGPVSLELDLMNRAASHQTYFFKDCSLVSKLSYRPNKHWNIFAKYSYDVNKTNTDADLCVSSGTELNMIGAGLEYFPISKKLTSLRLHANCFYAWGKNANPANEYQNKTTMLDFGVTWYMNILKVNR